MHARKIVRETCGIFKRSKPKCMHRTPFSAFCTFPYSLTHFLSSHTHAHTHHHSYYCLILMSNLSLLPSFTLPSPSISLPSSRRAWERDTSLIVISMETAQQQAWRRQPIAGLRSSASHPMAEAGERGGHMRRSYGPRQGECSGRRDQERSLPGCTENISIFDVGRICEIERFLSALSGTSLMIT